MKQLTTRLRAASHWSLDSFHSQQWVKKTSDATSHTHYPIKLLRYWFMQQFILQQHTRLNRPLRICEIGVDRGQMRRYSQDSGFTDIACWEAVDCNLQTYLSESPYTKQIQADVDAPAFHLEEKYDVIIVLHLLEHLFEPEKLMQKLALSLNNEGIVIGGFPVLPSVIESYWQNKIRKTAKAFGHVCIFSPKRVEQMARDCELHLDFSSGAYLLRKRNFALENHPLWVRLNLLWGALFPALGSEIYWCMRL
jgi:SAM-dependent methyltransferase